MAASFFTASGSSWWQNRCRARIETKRPIHESKPDARGQCFFSLWLWKASSSDGNIKYPVPYSMRRCMSIDFSTVPYRHRRVSNGRYGHITNEKKVDRVIVHRYLVFYSTCYSPANRWIERYYSFRLWTYDCKSNEIKIASIYSWFDHTSHHHSVFVEKWRHPNQ